MVNSINSDSSNTNLERGLAALKDGDYASSIELLEMVNATELHEPTLVKAQMGLVIAYSKTKQVTKAIEVCRILNQSSQSKAKTWAINQLKTLEKLMPHPLPKTPPKDAGFIPLDPISPQGISQPKIEPTGFMPFNSDDLESPTPNITNQQKIDPTGFIPFNSDDLESPTPNITNQPKIEPTGFMAFNSDDLESPTPNIINQPKIEPTGFMAFDSDDLESPFASSTADNQEINIDESSKFNLNDLKLLLNNKPIKENKLILDTIPETTNTASDVKEKQPELINETEAESETYRLIWRNAERAKTQRPRLKPIQLNKLYFTQCGSLIALFLTTYYLLKITLPTINNLLDWLPIVGPIDAFYYDPAQFLVILFAILIIASPWLIDGILTTLYGMKILPQTTLLNHYQETYRLIRNFCQNRNIPTPSFKILPFSVPVAFSYGCWPRFARIVVSQGLLEQLTEEEIATIYARELAHINHGDFIIISLATLLGQIPYIIYSQSAYWADYVVNLKRIRWPKYVPQRLKSTLPFLQSIFKPIALIISPISYSIYWLLRWPMLWLSRQRVYYSDRVAADLTGNPNALTRSLLKIAIGMASDIQSQKQTSFFLESFNLLIPVGDKQAITLGSLAPNTPVVPLLQWDLRNPYRKWLVINNDHPPMGERLQILARYAQFWQLPNELDLDLETKTPKAKINYQRLAEQGAPFFGILMGLAMGLLFWLIGGIGHLVGLVPIKWLWLDRSILLGFMPIGLSLGILTRINQFFPDLNPTKLKHTPSLPELMAHTNPIPIDSQPVRLEGQIIGRRGPSNYFGQDLILQTAQGLIKLHYMDKLGPLGTLWPTGIKPGDFINQQMTVTGWWRRGVTPSIDIENLKAKNGSLYYNGHPIWSVILALIMALWGAYIVVRG